MAGPFQIESTDIDELNRLIQEAGEPQPLDELCLRLIELVRQRAVAETAAAQPIGTSEALPARVYP